MRVALTILLCAALLLPPSVLAAPGDRAGLFVAERTWPGPVCGTPRIEVSTPERYQADHGTGFFEDDPQAWADENRCVIVINPHLKIRTATKRCHVIVHEWGHLAGREHSTNHRSVMYEDSSILVESLERDGRKRRWVVSGAFKPCIEATEPGVSFG